MDDADLEQETNSVPRADPAVNLPIVHRLIQWLAAIIESSEEEQANAGVYRGGEGRE